MLARRPNPVATNQRQRVRQIAQPFQQQASTGQPKRCLPPLIEREILQTQQHYLSSRIYILKPKFQHILLLSLQKGKQK